MCGIIGYTGPRPVVPILLDGLKRLEYIIQIGKEQRLPAGNHELAETERIRLFTDPPQYGGRKPGLFRCHAVGGTMPTPEITAVIIGDINHGSWNSGFMTLPDLQDFFEYFRLFLFQPFPFRGFGFSPDSGFLVFLAHIATLYR